jgi:DNA-binding winged helix-turn-helix (wHTH) protein/tetratricopeptide (TPR) repeat protein
MNGPRIVYVFGDCELDTARHRLTVGGQAVELEPKAFAVLQYLLEHAGTLRSRDELLDAVWGHRHVTPAVLNRCVGQLRKVLGDHADDPQYIQTVHSLGYRFVARVKVRGEPADVPASTQTAPIPTPAASPARKPQRAAWWAIAAAIALVVAWVALPRGAGDAAMPMSDVVARAPTRVVIEPFSLPPQAADLRPQMRSLESTLAQGLAATPGLRVDRGAAVGASSGTLRLAGEWRLHVQLRDPAAKTPWSRTYALTLAGLGEVATSMQGDLLRVLRPESASLLDVEGRKLGADAYVRSGARAARGLQQRDKQDAIASFRRALELDPQNADAWCYLGGLHLRAYDENLQSIESVVPLASDAIERGLRLDPASSRCLQTKGQMLRFQGHTREAETYFRRALALDPALFEATVALATIEGDRGHFTQWRTLLERLVAERPDRGWLHCELIGAFETTGDPEAARAHEPLVYALHPELRNVNWHSASVDLTYGRMAAGIRRYQALSAFDPDDRSYHLVASYAASEIGATALAKSELDKAGIIDSVHYPLAHVWLFYALDDPGSAVAWLRKVRLPPSSALVQRGWMAQSLALAGKRDEALAEYARVFEDGYRDADPTMALNSAWTYSAQLLNYATLLGSGARRDDAVGAAARHLAKMRADGLGMPWVHYQAAQIAVLQGDVDGGMAALDLAMDAGYSDALSLYRDLAWREIGDDPRFRARQARLSGIAREQRRLLSGDLAAAPDATVTNALR